MREVSRDEKWYGQVEPDKAVHPESQSGPTPDDTGGSVGPHLHFEAEPSGPSETELVTVALLMRLYDVGIAILSSLDEERANLVYETHEKGGHLNPPVFIPDMNAISDEE